jgi:hypothetical protein
VFIGGWTENIKSQEETNRQIDQEKEMSLKKI